MKPSKYRAVKTVVDGVTFASKREAARYLELKLMERGGIISDLHLQEPYAMVVNGVKICKYYADFVYMEAGQLVCEDVKGMRTQVYNLKKRLMQACHGITIREVK